MSFCSKLFVALAAVLVALVAYLLQSDHYLLGLAKVLWRANREVILPAQPVHWQTTSLTPRRSAKAPNILFILADDLGFNDLSGGAGALTPHIDSIGSNGVRFTQAYSAHATCAPSRAAILTGRVPTRMGWEYTPTPKFFGKLIGDLTKWQKIDFPPLFRSDLYKDAPNMEELAVPAEYAVLPQMLRPLGYSSYHLGKWDSGFKNASSPIGRGYDESLSFLLGAGPYGAKGEVVNAKGIPLDTLLLQLTNYHIQHNNGPRFQPEGYITDYLTARAVELIAAAHGPWYLSVSYNAPHNPFQASIEDYNAPDLSHLDHNERVYAAMIRALDRGVGQLLQALRTSGQWDNTIVVFTSDNGGASYASMAPDLNKPFRGFKATLFEGGLRVPALMQWPAQLQAMTVYDQPTMSVDFLPTFIAAAGGNEHEEVQRMMQGIDGKDLLPALMNQSLLEERALFWRCGDYHAMRIGDSKLMTHSHPDKVWYFRLADDPFEQINLAEHANITSKSQLDMLHAQGCPASPGHEGELRCEILRAYDRLLEEDRRQAPALWTSLASVAICIDHIATIPCKRGEEHTYFAN